MKKYVILSVTILSSIVSPLQPAHAAGWGSVVLGVAGGYVAGHFLGSRSGYSQGYSAGRSTGGGGGGGGSSGPSSADIEEGVSAALKKQAIADRRQILEDRMAHNRLVYAIKQKEISDAVHKIVANPANKGKILCTAYCGSFSDNGSLSVDALLQVGTAKGAAYDVLAKKCGSGNISFSEMLDGTRPNKVNGTQEPVQQVVEADADSVCEAISND